MLANLLKLKPKIIIVAAHPLTINTFLREITRRLSKWAEIYVLINFDQNDFIHSDVKENAKLISVPIQRKISLLKDLWAFFILLKEIFLIKPNCIISATPKAGFLTQLSSFLLMIQTRLHIFTGQVWVNKKRILRYILKNIDTLTGKFTTMNLVDGSAQQKFLVNEKVLNYRKSRVTGYGSVSGVDLNKFRFSIKHRNELRSKYNLQDNDLVIIYLGRIDKDKGISDLVEAFEKFILPKNKNSHLFIVGYPESSSLISSLMQSKEILGRHLQLIGPTLNPEKYLSFADIFCLPSYREGLNVTLLEAAACELSCVSTDIYGTHDALIDEISGLKYKPKDIEQLASQINRIIKDKKLTAKLKANALERVKKYFDSKIVSELFDKFIFDLLKK